MKKLKKLSTDKVKNNLKIRVFKSETKCSRLTVDSRICNIDKFNEFFQIVDYTKDFKNTVSSYCFTNLTKLVTNYSDFRTPPENVKVVILGQDPYHGPNQAHGMSFSVLPGIKPPPSLKNIYKEIEQEFGYKMDEKNGYLMPWVEQGVMLINSVMTVEASNPASHKGMGWETFTDKVIQTLSENFEHIVFMLWGSYAKAKTSLIDHKKHLILTSAHPSPFSAHNGFFGNNHFKKANEYLKESGLEEVNWKI